jgi:hypothetical protein
MSEPCTITLPLGESSRLQEPSTLARPRSELSISERQIAREGQLGRQGDAAIDRDVLTGRAREPEIEEDRARLLGVVGPGRIEAGQVVDPDGAVPPAGSAGAAAGDGGVLPSGHDGRARRGLVLAGDREADEQGVADVAPAGREEGALELRRGCLGEARVRRAGAAGGEDGGGERRAEHERIEDLQCGQVRHGLILQSDEPGRFPTSIVRNS